MAPQQLNSSHFLWPQAISKLAQPPAQLYVKGELPHDRPTLAIVGSRRPSHYGATITNQLAYQAAQAGIVIVSGLALGVDAVAHSACLESGGRTLAVLAHGLDRVYPARHQQLAQQILEQGGGLVSEYPFGTPPLKHHFIARNRLIAALADAVLVTEATERSGTTSTANFALELGKEVMAVPGNVTSQLSRGTNRLIQAGAHPIIEADDILQILGVSRLASNEPSESMAHSKEESIIIALLKKGTHDGNILQQSSGLPAASFSQAMTALEIAGMIIPSGGNQWYAKH